jgi:UDP-4-amino-4,6-dideoxy-N-acetyl-beta-L-altrosamine transaminase
MIYQNIPYGHQSISDDDVQAVVTALKSDYLTCGPAIPEFEKVFAEYVNAKHAVAVCNATAALHIAAMALGVKEGDNIICTPITFASSANCIRFCGGNVKFVDINPETYLLDIDKLEETLAASPKGTYKGMVLVDFAGYPHNMEEYRKVADEYGMWILEDACHAPGAYFTDSTGEKVYAGCGKYSEITVFSFHPVKHITTGEGGMACTQNDELFEKMALYRAHGITHNADKLQRQDGLWYYEMQELGYNFRITDIQAALGSSQMKRARKNVEIRRELVRKYNAAFAGIEGINTPYEAADVYHAYHLYIIQVEDRLGLYNFLRKNKIFAQVLYYPLNLMPYYKQFGNKEGDSPVAEKYYKHCLALPMFPTLTDEQQEYVISKVKEFICR